MFEIIEKKINISKDRDLVKKIMQDSLPQIYNSLHPSGSSLVTEARIQLANDREELKEWVRKNKEKVPDIPISVKMAIERLQNMKTRVQRLI
jgi:hypothetical protein